MISNMPHYSMLCRNPKIFYMKVYAHKLPLRAGGPTAGLGFEGDGSPRGPNASEVDGAPLRPPSWEQSQGREQGAAVACGLWSGIGI